MTGIAARLQQLVRPSEVGGGGSLGRRRAVISRCGHRRQSGPHRCRCGPGEGQVPLGPIFCTAAAPASSGDRACGQVHLDSLLAAAQVWLPRLLAGVNVIGPRGDQQRLQHVPARCLRCCTPRGRLSVARPIRSPPVAEHHVQGAQIRGQRIRTTGVVVVSTANPVLVRAWPTMLPSLSCSNPESSSAGPLTSPTCSIAGHGAPAPPGCGPAPGRRRRRQS